MIVSRRRLLSLAASAAVVAGASGCFGSFGAAKALWKFNDGISSNKWLKWLLFLGLLIFPVYGLFVLGDILIFNTIEFFTGSNPLGSATRDLGNGNVVAFQRDENDPDLVRLEHRRHGSLVGVYYVKKDGEAFSLLDQQRKLIAVVSETNGTLTLRDKQGNVLVALDPDAMGALTSRSQSMGSVTASLEELIRQDNGAVAGLRAYQRDFLAVDTTGSR